MLKSVLATILIFMFIASQATLNEATLFSSASGLFSLKINVAPSSVPADSKSYESIFVQLQDANGAPARAFEDTTIHLSSSSAQIGSIDPEITILAGSTYAVARFRSTFTPGSTIVTAAATGYATVQATATTSGPVPTGLVLYSFPPTLPADNGAYPGIVVQLQDPNGSPARAQIGGVTVTLFCSDITIGTVDQVVTIKAGDTFATATFTTTHLSGSANITAIAQGYSSAKTKMTTKDTSAIATNLKVYVSPPSVPADGATHKQIAVQLQDSVGNIVRAPNDVSVTISSSSNATGTAQPSITIDRNEVYGLAEFSSTYLSGDTEITAAASDYEASQETLTTVGPIPSKIAVYTAPSS
jgi:hypothetical protein